MRSLTLIALSLAAALAPGRAAALEVFACEPEWAALTTELAGTAANVTVATTALQDVHMIEAKPSLVAKMRRADLVVCSGADLEVGWLPQLVRQSGNAKAAEGKGSFMAADFVATLEKPTVLDRSAGDIHPAGNPHVHLDPHRLLTIAKALSGRLAEVDAANAATYAQRYDDFAKRWTAAMTGWEKKAAPLAGKKLVVHHASWAYLEDWLHLTQIGQLEPKPGVPPTSAHLSSLIETTKSAPAFAIVSAAYQDPKPGEWLAERTGVPAVVLPFTVGGDAKSGDLFKLFDDTLDLLLAAAK